MAVQKVSVTLDAERVAQARALVGRGGLSSFVDEALDEKLQAERRRLDLLNHLAELEAGDPGTSEEHRAGDELADEILRSTR